jgi:hypothetical protein
MPKTRMGRDRFGARLIEASGFDGVRWPCESMITQKELSAEVLLYHGQ